MTTKWTANPLHRQEEEHLLFAPTTSDGGRHLVASMAVGYKRHASLVAAAPELLEALKLVLVGKRRCKIPASQESIHLMLCAACQGFAAIAKAEGTNA